MTQEQAIDEGWNTFRASIERAIGFPLTHYKEPQMKRRLTGLMRRLEVQDWDELMAAAHSRPEVLEEVKNTLTINVSEFFRQPEKFQDLQRNVLPALMRERPALRLWSAGCSIGCEPYTLSMILQELDPGGRHTVLATDVDVVTLQRAKSGDGYSESEVRSVPAPIRDRHFRASSSGYAVSDAVKSRVTFRKHDLLRDPYPQSVDLILCRNVVIYFTEEAKQTVLRSFTHALRPGGVLFMGGSEMILRPSDLGLRAMQGGFYTRAE